MVEVIDDDGTSDEPPSQPTASERSDITLRYIGRDVDDGSIGVDDLISALNGFSGAFYKIAEREALDYKERIKVTGISQSSANVHLAIIEWAQAHPLLGGAISTVGTGVGYAVKDQAADATKKVGKKIADLVIGRISRIANAKKHVQRGPYTTQIQGNKIIIINSFNATLPLDREDFKIFEDGVIDSELDKMASPLRAESVDAFEIRHDNAEAPDLHIDAAERPYFARQRREATTTQELTLVGEMTSISKTTNSGTFVTDAGRKMRFKFADPEKLPEFYRHFAHLGPVNVRCTAKLDDNLDVMSIEISDVQALRK